MADIPTVEIPAPYYDAALAFCNERLTEQGKPTITALPPGVGGNGNECPCGNACGRFISTRYWWDAKPAPAEESRGHGSIGRLPEGVRGFVREFDHAYVNRESAAPVLPLRKEVA